MKIKKLVLILSSIVILVIAFLVVLAFSRTWGKTDIEFKVHINETLVLQSTFGESPTFAFWIENPANGEIRTIYVTKRAALGDWEGKASVPVALPAWFEIYKRQGQADVVPNLDENSSLTITGATPQPGYFTARVRVPRDSKWNCYIEVNLAGDFNDDYQMYNEEEKTSDEYLSGQPALLYKAEITAEAGNLVAPGVEGMSLLDDEGKAVLKPLKGITTATDIFDEIEILALRPKPRIIEWK